MDTGFISDKILMLSKQILSTFNLHYKYASAIETVFWGYEKTLLSSVMDVMYIANLFHCSI